MNSGDTTPVISDSAAVSGCARVRFWTEHPEATSANSNGTSSQLLANSNRVNVYMRLNVPPPPLVTKKKRPEAAFLMSLLEDQSSMTSTFPL